MTSQVAVALDVGGSHVTATAVNLETRTLAGKPARLDLPHTASLEALIEGWARVAVQAARQHQRVTHLGLAVPGPFDLSEGVSQMEHKFQAIRDVALRPRLVEQFQGTPLDGVPMVFGNDADMFALGEWWAGAGRGTRRMIGVTLGTGLGSGFVQGGQLIHAGRDVPPGGELWNVPFRDGITEDYANGAAITRLAEALTGKSMTAKELAAHASPDTQPVFERYGRQLAEILAPWVTAFGAERVVLGGNVSRAFRLFGPALQSALPSGCTACQSEHFEDAALLGAALLKP